MLMQLVIDLLYCIYDMHFVVFLLFYFRFCGHQLQFQTLKQYREVSKYYKNKYKLIRPPFSKTVQVLHSTLATRTALEEKTSRTSLDFSGKIVPFGEALPDKPEDEDR